MFAFPLKIHTFNKWND